ncbi:hypothetical protein TNCV_2467571 [Trichonephila clavipes]|nr:hypothetical protein TNCV_2467571 [Trichonephila clavipes]
MDPVSLRKAFYLSIYLSDNFVTKRSQLHCSSRKALPPSVNLSNSTKSQVIAYTVGSSDLTLIKVVLKSYLFTQKVNFNPIEFSRLSVIVSIIGAGSWGFCIVVFGEGEIVTPVRVLKVSVPLLGCNCKILFSDDEVVTPACVLGSHASFRV